MDTLNREDILAAAASFKENELVRESQKTALTASIWFTVFWIINGIKNIITS